MIGFERFAEENGLAESLEAALENAGANLVWADENVPVIKDVLQKMDI